MIALVAMAKDELNLVEWCRYNKAIGFDKIFIYANDWMPSYALPNYVTVIPIAGTCKQLFAYNDWIKRFEKFYTHVAFFDADEFLYFPNGDKVTDLIKRLPNKHIAINWVMFGSDELPSDAAPEPGIINRFLYRSATVNDHVKTILRLHQGARMTSPHHSNQFGYSPENMIVTGSFNTRGSMENCFLAHYWTQDVDYWTRKIARGRPDTGMDRNRTWKDFDNHNITCNAVYDDRLTKVEYER